VEASGMSLTDLIPPFLTSAGDLGKPLTLNMEVATVMFLVESERKKHGLLDSRPKDLLFVSKLYYPMWIVPWENESLVFEALGISSNSIDYRALPDVPAFVEDIWWSASVRDQFWSTLRKHEMTFKTFVRTDKVQINPLVTDEELLSSIYDCSKETTLQEPEAKEITAAILHKLDKEVAEEHASKASSLLKQIKLEIKSLEYAERLLSDTEKLHKQMILKEVELTRGMFETKIAELRPEVENKIEQLEKERDTRIAKMTKTAEPELKEKQREMGKHERELRRLELDKADCLGKLQHRKHRKDKVGETQLKHQMKAYENKIADAKARRKSLSDLIARTQMQNETERQRIRFGYQNLIDRERSKITGIEAQLDSIIATKQTELNNLQITSGEISAQIQGLLQLKKEDEKGLRKLGLGLRFEVDTLLSIPFYIAGYKAEGKIQLHAFPPLRIGQPSGIMSTLQKAIGDLKQASELKLHLQPRSKALNRIVDFVIQKASTGGTFNENLRKAAESGNILTKNEFNQQLTTGIKELRYEGWVSQREADSLAKSYI
jgi:hypothetical protein